MMVANVGYAPYYGNKEFTIETHILKEFTNDFYNEGKIFIFHITMLYLILMYN